MNLDCSNTAKRGVKMTDFSSNSDLNLKIICCIVRRLSTKEALDYLKENGHDMKERTFYDHKNTLMNSKNERILDAVNGSVWNHFKLMDSLELIQQKLWKDIETTDVDQKLKIYNMIIQNELLISKCHDELLPVIDRQIESYRVLELSDRLTYAEDQKVSAENTKIYLKDKICSLEEKVNKPYEDPMRLPDPQGEYNERKTNARRELEKTKHRLEKLSSRDDVS